MHPRHETNIFDKYQAWQRQEKGVDWYEAYVNHGKSMLETHTWLCETHPRGIVASINPGNVDATGILDDVFAPYKQP